MRIRDELLAFASSLISDAPLAVVCCVGLAIFLSSLTNLGMRHRARFLLHQVDNPQAKTTVHGALPTFQACHEETQRTHRSTANLPLQGAPRERALTKARRLKGIGFSNPT